MKHIDFKDIESTLKGRFVGEKILSLKDLPKPEQLTNLQEIAKRLKQAINQKKRIVIVGDYDVDGVVSCAILQDFFTRVDYPIYVEIPHRFLDGYGLSEKIVKRLQCDVILTVDNGINALEAAKICRELLITDHHTPQELLPEALICNPKLSKDFPEPEICGACVAWYLCAALKAEMNWEYSLLESLDLLSLAIVSDVMPLLGMNRVLLKRGLEILQNSKRLAFVQLKNHFAKHSISAQLIGYYIAPLLNCAGRMESAMLSYQFLIENDLKESGVLLDKLLLLNAQRKDLQVRMYEEAKEMFCAQKDYEKLPFIIVFNPQWHEGIVGIIAAHLSEEFSKPCIVLTQKEGILKGSMRSSSVDCMEALNSVKEFLCAFGGHCGAAGLSLKLESFEDFKRTLENQRFCENAKETRYSDVLGWLSLGAVNDALFFMIQKYAPFGNGNEIPKFYAQARILNVHYFGRGHSNILLKDEGGECHALVFNADLRQYKGRALECVYYLQWDQYLQKVILYLDSYVFL